MLTSGLRCSSVKQWRVPHTSMKLIILYKYEVCCWARIRILYVWRARCLRKDLKQIWSKKIKRSMLFWSTRRGHWGLPSKYAQFARLHQQPSIQLKVVITKVSRKLGVGALSCLRAATDRLLKCVCLCTLISYDIIHLRRVASALPIELRTRLRQLLHDGSAGIR